MQDEDQKDPLELIAAFSRTQGFPKDIAGLQCFAQGLVKAATRYGVGTEELVNKCLDTSHFCPTDADLLQVASDMAAERKRKSEPTLAQQRAAMERQCGPSQPFDWKVLDRGRVDAVKSRERELWARLKADPRSHVDGKWINWHDLGTLAEELGFADYARGWGIK